MAPTVDAIVAKFPVKSIPTITGEPNYDAINQMVQTLYGNAASLATTLGGGAYGHIGNIMTPPLHATLTATPYELPMDPGALYQSFQEEQQKQFGNNSVQNTMKTAECSTITTTWAMPFKAQVINTVQDTYLSEMRNKYTGYLGVTTRDLLDHLLGRYGKITPANIKDCKRRMNAPIHSTQPIDIFFQRVDECIQ
jgi:hypothetical protein